MERDEDMSVRTYCDLIRYSYLHMRKGMKRRRSVKVISGSRELMRPGCSLIRNVGGLVRSVPDHVIPVQTTLETHTRSSTSLAENTKFWLEVRSRPVCS
jgi:hypothetical protein